MTPLREIPLRGRSPDKRVQRTRAPRFAWWCSPLTRHTLGGPDADGGVRELREVPPSAVAC